MNFAIFSNNWWQLEEIICWRVGNICESGDTFGTERDIVAPREGDLIAILDAGAYGFTMSSFYNARVRPAEILIETDRVHVIRKRQDLREALPYF